VSNALPLSMSNVSIPAAPASRPRPTFQLSAVPTVSRGATPTPAGHPLASVAFSRPSVMPATMGETPKPPAQPAAPLPRVAPPPVPRTTPERMLVARDRIRAAAEAGQRIRSYEVALDLDLSEFHFARQFRAAFGRSPHVYYDEVRAERARAFLRDGLADGEVARRVGFRRPAELRALLTKRADPASV
jgi:AraC-like DNA-binding protein